MMLLSRSASQHVLLRLYASSWFSLARLSINSVAHTVISPGSVRYILLLSGCTLSHPPSRPPRSFEYLAVAVPHPHPLPLFKAPCFRFHSSPSFSLTSLELAPLFPNASSLAWLILAKGLSHISPFSRFLFPLTNTHTYQNPLSVHPLCLCPQSPFFLLITFSYLCLC